MAIRIDKKIVDYRVGKEESQEEQQVPAANEAQPVPAPQDNIVQLHEKLERPEMLIGSTYKVKTPVSDHAMYVTINDIVLNQGTEHEKRRPFEIFINSKNLDHYQWIVALTRIISAVFRKGGDVAFLVDELKAVFDPRGGERLPGGGEVARGPVRPGGVLHLPELHAEDAARREMAHQLPHVAPSILGVGEEVEDGAVMPELERPAEVEAQTCPVA